MNQRKAGTSAAVRALAVPGRTTVHDLGGRMVLPGLIDSHVHAPAAAMFEHDHEVPDMETIADLAGWFQATDVSAIVRIHKSFTHLIPAILDQGIMGIQVSDVETVEEARAIVDVAKVIPMPKAAGKWNTYDIIAQGMSGIMMMTGLQGSRPVKVGIAMNDIAAGITTTYAVLGALIGKLRHGKGQYVETSLLEATVSLGVYEAANYFATGVRPEKLGQGHRGSSPYQVFQTKDGWLTIGAAQQNFFRKVCELIGKPELIDDPRFKVNALRVKNNDAIVAILQADAFEKRLGACRVEIGPRQIRDVPRTVPPRDGTEGRFGRPEKHRVHNGLAIDG